MEQQARSQPEKPLPVDRLRAYLRQLTPTAHNLLMREFERALERGDDVSVANFVLGELRKIVRATDTNERPRTMDPARLVFSCLDPFLTNEGDMRPGQIRRSSLEPTWIWLSQTAIASEVEELNLALDSAEAIPSPQADQAVRKFQVAAAEAISMAVSPASRGGDRNRSLTRVGSPSAVEDLPTIGLVLGHRDALETFQSRLPKILRAFGDPQISSIKGQLN